MAHLSPSAISCGVRQLSGLSPHTPKQILQQILSTQSLYVNDATRYFCMILFSDTVKKNSGGVALAKYIEDNKLGSVIASKVKTNPNSHNKIQVWIWHVDKRALARWYKENARA